MTSLNEVNNDDPLLQVEGLTKRFPVRKGFVEELLPARRFVHAVNQLSFTIGHEEAFGLVGESGSGKSTTGRMIARLIEPTAGTIRLNGVDWLKLKGRELRSQRRHVQMVFQNPFLSLNPRLRVGQIIAEPLKTHRIGSRAEISMHVEELMEAVGLDASQAGRYPHQFSGGQRQRIGLARALALHPQLLIADEAVSALDVSVQAQVLKVIRDIRTRFKLSMLFISHDLSVVKYICDRVGVMYLGELMEVAPTKALFSRPRHPYTKSLIDAVPRPSADRRSLPAPLTGEMPNPINPPPGCPFHTRCPIAETICGIERPPVHEFAHGQRVACHFPS